MIIARKILILIISKLFVYLTLVQIEKIFGAMEWYKLKYVKESHNTLTDLAFIRKLFTLWLNATSIEDYPECALIFGWALWARSNFTLAKHPNLDARKSGVLPPISGWLGFPPLFSNNFNISTVFLFAAQWIDVWWT